MRFAAIYGVLVGVFMVGWWALSLARRRVPEVRSEPIRLYFHLAAEAITAGALVTGGLGLLAETGWARSVFLVATGMLAYSVVVSPGYFAQLKEWVPVGVFAVLAILTVAAIVVVASGA